MVLPWKRCAPLRTTTYSAMSIANAMSVRRAATKERSGAYRATLTCDESENRRAITVTTEARERTHYDREKVSVESRDMSTGCTARPRVAPGPAMVTFDPDVSSESLTIAE